MVDKIDSAIADLHNAAGETRLNTDTLAEYINDLQKRISELEITLKLIQTEIDRWTGAKRYGEVFADQIRHIIKEQEDE